MLSQRRNGILSVTTRLSAKSLSASKFLSIYIEAQLPEISPPDEHGLMYEYRVSCVDWMNGNPAPNVVLEFCPKNDSSSDKV